MRIDEAFSVVDCGDNRRFSAWPLVFDQGVLPALLERKSSPGG